METMNLHYVAQAETASTVDAPAADEPPSGRFTWRIENFSKLNARKLYSDVFIVGGFKWYLNRYFLLSYILLEFMLLNFISF